MKKKQRLPVPHFLHIGKDRLATWIIGAEANPPLLYLHGGPGYNCFDFLFYTTPHLKKVKLYLLDQYGSGKSSRIEKNESVTIDRIVDHLEGFRLFSGLASWSVLGHSYGSTIAVRYATRYPQYLNCLILVSPIICLLTSLRELLNNCIAHLKKKGDVDRIRTLEKLRFGTTGALDIDHIKQFLKQIEPIRDEIYFHTRKAILTEAALEKLAIDSGAYLPHEYENDSRLLASLLTNPQRNFYVGENLKHITVPTLMIVGRYDPILSTTMADQIADTIPNASLAIMEKSAHHPYLEEPENFSKRTIEFVMKHC